MPVALIVEDEPEANHLLAMLVQLRGYRTDSAYTGGEALEKVRDQPPDLVFLDLMLPDINGYEVCQSIKGGRDTSLIPVVMVTARVAAENRLQSFRVGADDYIPKPYTPDQIFRAMADADAWRRGLQRLEAEGEIRLDPREEAEPLRQLAQLRNLLVGRTSLDGESIRRIGAALKEIQAGAEAWALAHPGGPLPTLAYRLQADRATLALRDHAAWQSAQSLEGWTRWVVPAFDEVVTEDQGRRIRLLKHFAPVDPSPHG